MSGHNKAYIKILKRARKLVLKQIVSTPVYRCAYICLAILDVKGDVYLKDDLMVWIDKLLDGRGSLNLWLESNRPKENFTDLEVNRARVQWLDWMIATLKTETD